MEKRGEASLYVGRIYMRKQLALRSVAAASLMIGASVALGTAPASAQWTTSPDPPPISCSSWQTAFAGGMCRVEHFNGATSAPAGPPANVSVPPGTGLTGISPGSSTNSPTITSGSSTGGGATTSSGSGASATGATGTGGAAGATGASDSGAGAGGAGASGAGAGGAGGAGASGGSGGAGGSWGSGGGGNSQ